jgi:peptide methionine sulfoxide reductase MsrB
MVDNPNYKNHLKPEQYEVCWNKGTEAPFSGKYHDCKDKASTSVSAAAIAYLPLTPS